MIASLLVNSSSVQFLAAKSEAALFTPGGSRA